MQAVLKALEHVLRAMKSHNSNVVQFTHQMAELNQELKDLKERFKRVDPSDRLRG